MTNVILSARQVNDSMPEFVLERILNIMKIHGIVDVKRVGLFGLTYKENVDDTRLSQHCNYWSVLNQVAKRH